MKPFAVDTHRDESGLFKVTISGELDLAVADRLRAALDDAIGSQAQVVVVLADCEFIDSTGIALLLHTRQELLNSGGRLLLCEPVDQVQRVLSVSGLVDPEFVADSLNEARRQLKAR